MNGNKNTLLAPVTLETAVEFLRENGFPTSKAKIYKLTSCNQIPYSKYGNKLVFSRIKLLAWANQKSKEQKIREE